MKNCENWVGGKLLFDEALVPVVQVGSPVTMDVTRPHVPLEISPLDAGMVS